MRAMVIIVILFYQHQNVTSSRTYNFFAEKLNEFASSVQQIFHKIKITIFPSMRNAAQEVSTYGTSQKIGQKFNEFLTTMISEIIVDGSDYTKISFDPTVIMSTPKLAASHGRHIETHKVYTKDGYILTIHRLLPKNYTTQTNRTVLLHHGLLGSSMDWILLGPVKSLPYILSDAGYDVWMANARGNYYSRDHIEFKIDSPQFWNFSWQEMGQFDLPATIDYMRERKNASEKINYIGHSMGTTALLVLLSTVPLYNEYLRIGILLAPLAFMTETKGPLRTFSSFDMKTSERVLNVIGHEEFLPSRRVPDRVASLYCVGQRMYCRNPLLFLSGSVPNENSNTMDNSFIAQLLYHVPAGGSTKTILHYAQLIATGRFHMFNKLSSEFPLKKISLPIVLFSSDGDWLAAISDVFKLFFNIANPVEHYIIRDKNVRHTDFVWGSEANVLIFRKVMDYMENGLKDNITKLYEIVKITENLIS